MAEIDDALASLDLEARQLAEDATAGRPANPIQAERLMILARRLKGLLHNPVIHDTLDGMTPLKAEAARRRSESKGFFHPFHKVINARNISIAEAAKKLGVMPAVARGWVRSKDTRPIHEDIANKAEKVYGIEATAKNWPNGIRRKN